LALERERERDRGRDRERERERGREVSPTLAYKIHAWCNIQINKTHNKEKLGDSLSPSLSSSPALSLSLCFSSYL
jgi:hypothetical protein